MMMAKFALTLNTGYGHVAVVQVFLYIYSAIFSLKNHHPKQTSAQGQRVNQYLR